MNVSEDIKTISTQMAANFAVGSPFYLTDVLLCDLLSDITFCYLKPVTSNVIIIEIYNDKIRDRNEVGVALLNFTITQVANKRPLLEFCELAVENLLEYLKTVVFDTLTGRFVPADLAPKINKSAINLAKKNIFRSIGVNVLETAGECCVCYEKTNTKTQCGHYLCFKCASQLKTAENEDEAEN